MIYLHPAMVIGDPLTGTTDPDASYIWLPSCHPERINPMPGTS